MLVLRTFEKLRTTTTTISSANCLRFMSENVHFCCWHEGFLLEHFAFHAFIGFYLSSFSPCLRYYCTKSKFTLRNKHTRAYTYIYYGEAFWENFV